MQRLELRCLGFPEFRLNGRPAELALRRATGLVVFLAEAGGPVGRETAATLLWPDADEATSKARLRRLLHRIHAAFGEEIIAADRTSLRFQPALEIALDSRAFEHDCDRGDLDAAADRYAGDFLAGLSLNGCPEFEEWAFFRREALRSRLVQVLERLVAAKIAGGEPRAAVAHATRLVGLDPLSETAHRHLMRAHLASGNPAAAKRQLEACARSLREELGVTPDAATVALLEQDGRSAAAEMPRTRYVEVDGVHIAFQTTGNGPVDIVLVPGFVSHVERIWEDVRCRACLSGILRIGRLILFDRRGVGLSDRIGARPTMEATAEDLLAVLDAAGSRRALLVGSSEGGPGCIRFAVDHPGRLLGLVLWGSLAKGCRGPDHPFGLTAEQFDLWQKRLIEAWGGPAEIGTFAPSLVGDRQAEAWWAGLLRAASSPGAIKGVLEALRDTDVRHLLPRVAVPTVVLHRTGDRAVRVDAGRHLAASIPSAELIELPGDDHWFWVGDREPLIRKMHEMARRYC
jgi:DNA-binding SARP family transcriptional activator/pimeloyl-ACP methyl ester carboxylesterase